MARRIRSERSYTVSMLHAFRQAAGDLGDLLLDVGDHVQRVLAVARHDDARHHLALAVELGQAAPLVRAQLDAGDVAEQHRHAFSLLTTSCSRSLLPRR